MGRVWQDETEGKSNCEGKCKGKEEKIEGRRKTGNLNRRRNDRKVAAGGKKSEEERRGGKKRRKSGRHFSLGDESSAR